MATLNDSQQPTLSNIDHDTFKLAGLNVVARALFRRFPVALLTRLLEEKMPESPPLS
jgi:hypothetical protein